MGSRKIRVCIVQPADPCGTVPGGIDTFIRGEINSAPDDIEYSVIGITTDPAARPVGQWTQCALQSNSFNFYPVVQHRYTHKARRIPVILRYLLNLGAVVSSINPDVVEIHRIETALRINANQVPITAVLHQNMQSLYDKQADILWSRLPQAYFWLEDKLIPKLKSAFCVRTDATEHYRQRYPNLASSCHFQATWADPRQFTPPSIAERKQVKAELAAEYGWEETTRLLLSVGRLDAQKNPLLLIESVKRLVESMQHDFRLLMVGEGPLRGAILQLVENAGLADKVRLVGVKSIDEVTRLLHAADLFVMSSAYEGMPMAVIEALASGVPVATTQVGEVARVVEDHVCGRITEEHSEEKLAEIIAWCLQHLGQISGAPCTMAASRFSPDVVLQPVYENYRLLAKSHTGSD